MEYTISKLANLSGISTRTLRYYDQIGLLRPAKRSENEYRVYGEKEVDQLQQILFYRELGVPLEEIDQILNGPNYDKEKSLNNHLTALLQRKNQIELLIANVSKTINTLKGVSIMENTEKFEGFKQKMIEENEKKYGEEMRSKYGVETLDASNSKVKGMSEAQWKKTQELSALINETLKKALKLGNPKSEMAQKACELHKQWLCMFWEKSMYSKETHLALVESYVQDPRFTKYYDEIGPGCAQFLKEAMTIYCK